MSAITSDPVSTKQTAVSLFDEMAHMPGSLLSLSIRVREQNPSDPGVWKTSVLQVSVIGRWQGTDLFGFTLCNTCCCLTVA